MVKAWLSIFSGPHVESSFSLMSNIISKRSNCMDIDTYNAVVTIYYSLQSKATSDLYQHPEMHYLIPLKKKGQETAG